MSPIFIPASAFITLATATQKNQLPVFTLPDAATTTLRTSYMVPAWATTANITVKVYFSIDTLNGASSTGVRLSTQTVSSAVGSTIQAVNTSNATETIPANEAANTIHATSVETALAPVATGQILTIRVDRLGNDGADTYTGSISFIGITINPTVNL